MSPLISVMYYFYIVKDDKYRMSRATKLLTSPPGTELYFLIELFFLLPLFLQLVNAD